MKILFVASEAAPFVKTGGLGEVVGSLPKTLAQAGIDVRVILPRYAAIAPQHVAAMRLAGHCQVRLGRVRTRPAAVYSLREGGVTFYFLANDDLFNRPEIYGSWDDGERFAFFCQGVLAALPGLDFQPDLIHCHDWQGAMLPLVLDRCWREQPFYRHTATLLTIHNLRYQGLFPAGVLTMFSLPGDVFTSQYLEYFGLASYLKGGMAAADGLSTVSPTYAGEILRPEFGEGLDGFLRTRADQLWGILNGIDQEVYDPAHDPNLQQKYDANSFAGKAADKKALQQELGLPCRPGTPLVAMVGRLTGQKGTEIVSSALGDLLSRDLQLVVLGSGEANYEDAFRRWDSQRRDRLRAVIGYDDALAHRIYAAADIFLMPSIFEPCGIGQMIAMRYGALPLVRETGGLRDTVYNYQADSGEGSGFTFAGKDRTALLDTLDRALALYRQPAAWQKVAVRNMGLDFSWAASAREYRLLYETLIARRRGAKEE